MAKISNEKKLMRDMILIDFEEEIIEEPADLETTRSTVRRVD